MTCSCDVHYLPSLLHAFQAVTVVLDAGGECLAGSWRLGSVNTWPHPAAALFQGGRLGMHICGGCYCKDPRHWQWYADSPIYLIQPLCEREFPSLAMVKAICVKSQCDIRLQLAGTAGPCVQDCVRDCADTIRTHHLLTV